AQAQHENEEASWAERTVRRDDRRKDFRIEAIAFAAVIVVIVVVVHVAHYTKIPIPEKMSNKMPKKIRLAKSLAHKTVRQRLAAARKGRAAHLKGVKARVAGDRKAAHGNEHG